MSLCLCAPLTHWVGGDRHIRCRKEGPPTLRSIVEVEHRNTMRTVAAFFKGSLSQDALLRIRIACCNGRAPSVKQAQFIS